MNIFNKGGSKSYINNKVSADSVATELGGKVTELKNRYKVEIPNRNKTITVRIMNEGSGGRGKSYFRVSIDGKGYVTLVGVISSDRALTHIDMTDDYLDEIISIINKYKK